MSAADLSLLHRSRRKPIAACIASLFALSASAPAIAATTWPVTSCADDGGAGTLRSVISAGTTLSGDTVSLSALSCVGSKISLVSSTLEVAQSSLTIQGPGAALQIDGSLLPRGSSAYSYSRLIKHTGTGTLTIADLSLSGGYLYHQGVPALGACIYSHGNVTLARAKVSSCTAISVLGQAGGGGVYTQGNLTLSATTISGNVADGGGGALGGGARVGGTLSASYSTISGNTAAGGPCDQTTPIGSNTAQTSGACGGGLNVVGSVLISHSTISANSSSGRFGGIDAYSPTPAGKTFSLINSTISGNSAATVGGAYVNTATTHLYNSTIAFNSATTGSVNATFYSPGLELSTRYASMALVLKSTLISNNTYAAGASESDLSADFIGVHSISVNSAPANNFVRTTSVIGLPADTIQGSCPLLGPLRNNGGLTLTHALTSHSPAIDAGNNAVGSAADQRGRATINGTMTYPRVSGAVADIGAYEVQQGDIIFDTGFEACP